MTINVILQNYRAKQIKKIFVMINPIIYILFKVLRVNVMIYLQDRFVCTKIWYNLIQSH